MNEKKVFLVLLAGSLVITGVIHHTTSLLDGVSPLQFVVGFVAYKGVSSLLLTKLYVRFAPNLAGFFTGAKLAAGHFKFW